jgi:uncharacterized membrane protein YbjE (DUF340 family)
MVEVLIIMALGTIFGIVFRQKQKLISYINKTTMWIIATLLFFMGISVGINNSIMCNLKTIGIKGLNIAMVAILGSVITSWIVYTTLFKKTNNER